jgi:primosomal protein N' (replication factor Y) (superfamily II helicase)
VRTAGVQVLVDVPLFHLDRPFTYRVPEALAGQVHLGSRVKVPFGGRRRVDGWVVGRAPDLPPDARDLLRVVSPIPSFGPRELDLLRWVADRYAATVTDTLRLAIPPRVAAVERPTGQSEPETAAAGETGESGESAQGEAEKAEEGSAPDPSGPAPDPLRPALPPPGAAPYPPGAAPGPPVGERSPTGTRVRGLVHSPAAASPPSPASSPSSLSSPPSSPSSSSSPSDPLAALVAGGWAGAVYWRPLPGEDRGARVIALVEAALERGRGVIVVTPEVAAGSAVGDAVRKAFPDAADLASDLSDRRRYRAWAELRRGRRLVVVGGRSSVLAPLDGLGCVVVDDEANFAHKEQRTPRFHAREVALRRAAAARALCVLTGTVPSAEALAAMQAGQCRLLTPDRAAERAARPLVEVVDPDDEGPTAARLHPRGLAAIRAALGRQEPAYVLVPRRGGADPAAPGARTAGQVAAELARILPGVPVWRLDREVVDPGMVPPWAGQRPGVVVGTVAGVKDHPPLTGCRTVVVVGADAALGQAEVRAAEEAYRTWSRAAAWCGPRGGAGRLVLQTRHGGHHAVQALVRWDPEFFWRHELPRRVELGFPPARRLVLVEGPEPAEATAAMATLAAALGPKVELLGPAAMGRGWRIIAKVEDAESAARALRPLLAEASRAGGPRMSVDVEPLEVLATPR